MYVKQRVENHYQRELAIDMLLIFLDTVHIIEVYGLRHGKCDRTTPWDLNKMAAIAGDIFKGIFSEANVCVLFESALIHEMALHTPADKPSPESGNDDAILPRRHIASRGNELILYTNNCQQCDW